MRHVPALINRFANDERGVFAVLFGVMAIVLVALGGATVDYVTLEQTRARAQSALDATVLALQPEINRGITNEEIRARAEALVIERIGDTRVQANVDTITTDPQTGRLFLGGRFTMPTMFVSLVGVTELGASFSSEAMKGSLNMEIALALDVTGSMAGNRIKVLKEASTELVDVILANNSGDTTAKIAIVPYSQAVNAGTYAQAIRGPIVAPKNLTGVTWSTGSTKSITGATNTSPVKISSSYHGFKNNDWVYISGLNGVSHVNNQAFQVQSASTHSYELRGSTSNWWSSDATSGSAIKCQNAGCNPTLTSARHGFSTGDYIVITDVRGMTNLNNRLHQITATTRDTMVIGGMPAGGGGNYQANTGRIYCTWQNATEGCEYYRFQTQAGSWVASRVTTCVTERSANPFNDQPPYVTYAGRNYPPAGDCPSSVIVPLTDQRATLTTAISNLPATGTTSGSLGILWAWYMLSPNFGYIWPEMRRPEPYDTPDLLKAAIIMTDGDFNTVHYDGVLSRDSNIGSSSGRHRNNAHNGPPYEQAKRYCDELRKARITVYTVGFEIGTGSAAEEIMMYCASDPANYYSAANGEALKDSFRQIARNISALRLTM
ncbi:MAG: hypothetical protein GX970_03520 [Phyllobacteriaceae bacterium]|nr:hypothetical protein [Phyllobacteriaceae bacterium]